MIGEGGRCHGNKGNSREKRPQAGHWERLFITGKNESNLYATGGQRRSGYLVPRERRISCAKDGRPLSFTRGRTWEEVEAFSQQLREGGGHLFHLSQKKKGGP